MHVTVCICTRDRGESISRTLRSVLASAYRDFDIVVVDQSASDDTQHVVQRDARRYSHVTYMHTRTVGLSAARNVAVEHAKGPLVAFTDDDCEVPPEWLGRLLEYFAHFPDAGQILGEVRPGDHDNNLGFVPDYPIRKFKRISSPWMKWHEGGIGANMAFRLDTLRAVGPFDEMLSAGAPLFTCEDGDMTYRVLKAGYSVLNVPDAYVIHHGFRSWNQGRALMRRTGIGVGAAYMKHLRLGDVAILPTLVYEWIHCISWPRLLLLRPRSGLARFAGYAAGMILSFRYRIDSRWRVYLSR